MAKNFDRDMVIKIGERAGAYIVSYGFKEVGGKLTSEPSIIVTVPQKLPMSQVMATAVPKFIDGIPSDVQEGRMPWALQLPVLDIVERFRPAPGGCSVGVVGITAGTLGCWVNYNGRKVMLSNNHVLADSNDAEIGDAIVQPGPYDGGSYPQDHIANLTKFERLRFIGEQSGCTFSKSITRNLNRAYDVGSKITGERPRTRFPAPVVAQQEYNLIDAAIATPLNASDVDETILKIGKPQGVVSGELGMNVQKTGRTTEYTTGQITQVDAITQVSYGGTKIALFEDQIVITGTESFSAGGDSGSAVLDMLSNICALLFAGSDTVTICCRIENVFELLGVSL